MKHTKGNWELGPLELGVYSDADTHGLAVASCTPKLDYRTLEEAQANARLISAAPDLLEALIELRDLMEDVRTGDYKPDSFTSQIADKAIAKALGNDDRDTTRLKET